MKSLDYIRVVLIQSTHPGNIGATARAMANMGLSDLVLVDPVDFPNPVATARAAGADHVLSRARVVPTLDEAISDCAMVVGSTARARSIQWPEKTPEDAARDISDEFARHGDAAPVALLFGRESSGMTNGELERCRFLIRIPVEESFSSLNLASAVLVIIYELRKVLASDELAGRRDGDRLASASEMHHFYEHLQAFVKRIGFSDGRSSKLHRKMTRLFNRVQMYDQEVRMLRGMFRSVEDKLDGKY